MTKIHYVSEIEAVQKNADLVELEKCCQTHIFLQNFVLIQPRTSPPNIYKKLQKLRKENRSSCSPGSARRPPGTARPSRSSRTSRRRAASSTPGARPSCSSSRASSSSAKFSAKCRSFSAVQVTARVPKHAPLTCP